jgi:hypothetical protein
MPEHIRVLYPLALFALKAGRDRHVKCVTYDLGRLTMDD